MKNALVADIFRGCAELLEIKGDNPFRIRAYLRAADSIAALADDIERYAAEGRLRDIPAIGADLAQKIKEIIAKGTCASYEKLKKEVPAGVLRLLEIPSVGPKTAKLIYERLRIDSLNGLKTAAREGRLSGLPGIKEKSVENILKGIALIEKGHDRLDILSATTAAQEVVEALEATKTASRIAVAGSLRRARETVRDVDILAASRTPQKVSQAFAGLPFVKQVLAKGVTKSSILTKGNIQVDLRVIDKDVFGAALVYFTGSKNHNIKLRHLAQARGWKINEYGVFDRQGRRLASQTEEQVYAALGLDFIEPELREDSGELEAAAAHRLPDLLTLGDIRADFHAHTNYSDGVNSVEQMAQAARALGYGYLCLSDHSVSLKVANGLDEDRLKKKRAQIDRVNRTSRGLRVLFATEAEIDADGRIDYRDDILARFDVVIAAIHSGFKQTKQQLTRRIVRACQSKYVHIIAHPTGRLWRSRDSYDLDFEEVFKVCRETNTALEINSHPWRQDLSDVNARAAKDHGVRLVVTTDAHQTDHLAYMKFGVGLARRAWLTKKDVLNSLTLGAMLKAIKK